MIDRRLVGVCQILLLDGELFETRMDLCDDLYSIEKKKKKERNVLNRDVSFFVSRRNAYARLEN